MPRRASLRLPRANPQNQKETKETQNQRQETLSLCNCMYIRCMLLVLFRPGAWAFCTVISLALALFPLPAWRQVSTLALALACHPCLTSSSPSLGTVAFTLFLHPSPILLPLPTQASNGQGQVRCVRTFSCSSLLLITPSTNLEPREIGELFRLHAFSDILLFCFLLHLTSGIFPASTRHALRFSLLPSIIIAFDRTPDSRAWRSIFRRLQD